MLTKKMVDSAIEDVNGLIAESAAESTPPKREWFDLLEALEAYDKDPVPEKERVVHEKSAAASFALTAEDCEPSNSSWRFPRLGEDGSIRHCVSEFHEAMNVPVLTAPTHIEEERVKLRARLIAEEFFEVMEAMFEKRIELVHAKTVVEKCIDAGFSSVDLVKLADGLCDLDYVVEGTRLEFGIDGRAILAEVHSANMRKVGGPVREDGKRLKPPGWKPPDIEGVLRRLGWKG